MAAIGWGLAGSIELGCDWDSKGCGVPDGGELYFAAFFVPPWVLVIPFKLDLYASDWRPTLGLLVGALIGCVAAFSTGTTIGFWILSLALLAVGAVTPWATRRHSIKSQEKAHRQEQARRKQQARRERRARRQQQAGR